MRSMAKVKRPGEVPTGDGRVRDERSYEFITPVFGGGVRIDGARKRHDPVTPVRAPSLRGQLRFWWRAVNPRGCAAVAALHAAETAVFGAASVSSRDALDVAVIDQPKSYRELGVMVLEGMDAIAYGAFPLRDPDAVPHGVLHVHQGAWKVTFHYGEAVRDDVEAALWAWAHFGGLGGRTRRGFGAVKQVGGALPSIADGWKRWIAKETRPKSVPWPSLRADAATWMATSSRGHTTGLDAQKQLLGELRKLRQGPLGRNPQSANDPRRPGRSYWPEADAIRAVTKTRDPGHAQRVTQGEVFPRGAFGMPIVFHFKDRGDPKDTQLLPVVGGETLGRLSSPLVLRPHATTQGYEALALVLDHPAYDAVTLEGSRVKEAQRATVTHAEAAALRPLNTPAKTFTDPLLRYLHLVRTGT